MKKIIGWLDPKTRLILKNIIFKDSFEDFKKSLNKEDIFLVSYSLAYKNLNKLDSLLDNYKINIFSDFSEDIEGKVINLFIKRGLPCIEYNSNTISEIF